MVKKLQEKMCPVCLNKFDAIKRRKIYEVIGVECKINGVLSKEEKEKCQFLLNKGIFSEILIACKNKNRMIFKNVKGGEEWKL